MDRTILGLCLSLLVLLLVGGCTQTPTGPTTNVNGDHNVVMIPSDESSGNSVTTPAPVVVPPVVLTTPPQETQ